MSKLAVYLQSLTNAETTEELWSMHTAKMRDYGFDRLMYGFTRYKTSNSLGDPQDWVMLSNHDPKYVQSFVNDGFVYHAPMLNWALENSGACSWNWMGELARNNQLTPAQLQVLDFNKRMGVTAGYTVSFRSVSNRSKGAIALTAAVGVKQEAVEKVWEAHGNDIIVMNNVAHLKLLTLPYFGHRTLTPRQREVLEWVGDGKTAQDIAVLLGVTIATVEKHLRLAREALDVETTAQAVLKASFQNQMFVVGG